jgi:glycosyltransferase involved in cell wall biosynthesis
VAPVRRVVVVVPVRDEEQRIEACLDAIDHAVRRVHARPLSDDAKIVWSVPTVQTLVVLDSCTDDTAQIVARHPDVRVVATQAGRVGAARALGVRAGLALGDEPLEQAWIANTDADSRVPPDWLTHQLDLAHEGADVVCGLVDIDPTECGRATYAIWASRYNRFDGHPHVHGANLGVRADLYVASGGFDPGAAAHEDVALVQWARAQGRNVVASRHARVTTSGRTHGRVEDQGFAAYLRVFCSPPPASKICSTGPDLVSVALS